MEKRASSSDGIPLLPQTVPLDQDDRAQCATITSNYHRNALICLASHLLLVLVYAILLCISWAHYERSITFDLTPFSLQWYPLVVSNTVQVVATISLAILVTLTQSLSFQRDLGVPQTMTALHDKNNAWLGLGAACISLWQQHKLRTAPAAVACTFAYLFGIWLIHVTAPSVLVVVPFNATLSTTQRTVLANNTWSNANYVSAYDILTLLDQPNVPTVGLQDNIVYDIIPVVPNADGTTVVNASKYDVHCTAFNSTIGAQVTIPDPKDNPMSWLGPYVEVSPGVMPGPLDAMFAASVPYNVSMVYTARVPLNVARYGEVWTPMILLSTVPVLDSAGNVSPAPGGPWALLDPLVTLPLDSGKSYAIVPAVQLLACTVQIVPDILTLSAQDRTPMFPSQGSNATVLWETWTPPDTIQMLTDQLRLAQTAPFYSPPSGRTNAQGVSIGAPPGYNTTPIAPSSPLVFVGQGCDIINGSFRACTFEPPGYDDFISDMINANTSSGLIIPSNLDVFLTEDLGIVAGNRTNVTLAEVQHSLARALAAIFWYGNTVSYSSPYTIQEQSTQMGTDVTNMLVDAAGKPLRYGEATVMVIMQRLRLNLNIVPLVVGMVASFGMSIIYYYLAVRVPQAARASSGRRVLVESGGLLQYTWLLGTEPSLAQIKSPNLDALRAAGMFDVEFEQRLKKRFASDSQTTDVTAD